MPLHSARPFRKAIECTSPPFSPPTNGLGSLTLRNPSSGANAGQWKHLEYRQKLAGKFSTFLTLCAALLPQPPPFPVCARTHVEQRTPQEAPLTRIKTIPSRMRLGPENGGWRGSQLSEGTSVSWPGSASATGARTVSSCAMGVGGASERRRGEGGALRGGGEALGAPSPRPQVPAVSGPFAAVGVRIPTPPRPVRHPGQASRGGGGPFTQSSHPERWHGTFGVNRRDRSRALAGCVP